MSHSWFNPSRFNIIGIQYVTGSIVISPDGDSSTLERISVSTDATSGAALQISSSLVDNIIVANVDGNVGIGVSNPDQKLEVSGSIHLSAESTIPSAPSSGDGGNLYTKADGRLYWVSDDLSETDLTSGGESPNAGWVTASIEVSDSATALTASSLTDTLTFRAGSNISLTTEPSRNIIEIASSGSTDAFTGSQGTIIISGSTKTARIEISGSGDALIFGVHTNAQANALVVTGSGRVGIGTATPDYTLDVAGNAGFDEYIYHNGDADTFIRFQADQIDIEAGGTNMIYINEGGAGAQEDKVVINNDQGDVDFQVKGSNNANLFRVDTANERVGIGSQVPSASLEVSGSDNTSLLNIKSDSNTNIFEISGSSSTTTHVSSSVAISASNFIAYGGNSAQLSYAINTGTGNSSNRLGFYSDADTTMYLVGQGTQKILYDFSNDSMRMGDMGISWGSSPGGNLAARLRYIGTGRVNFDGNLTISGSRAAYDGTTARLSITGSDNSTLFGVHSATNANILQVTGSGHVIVGNAGTAEKPSLAITGTFPNNYGFYTLPSAEQLGISVAGAGQVLIGNTNMKSKRSGQWGLLHEDPTATNPNIVPNATDADTGIGSNASDQLSLIAGGTEALRLTTTAVSSSLRFIVSGSSARLEVTGSDAHGSIFGVHSNSNANIFTVSGSGKVGIGTGNPTHTLSVVGDISGSGDLYLGGQSSKIYGDSDKDTYIDFTTIDELNFWAGGERLLSLDENGTSSEVVVGDGGHVNFRAATAGYGFNLYVKSTNAGGVDNSVGIRTSSPQAVLDVSASLEGLAFRVGTHSSILVVSSSHEAIPEVGRVGIGVEDPDTALEVSGAIHLSAESAVPSAAPSAGDGGILYTKVDGKPYWVSNDISETGLITAHPNAGWVTASIETSAGATALTASSLTDTLTFRAGSYVSLTTEPERNIIQIAVSASTDTFTGSAGPIVISGSSIGTRVEISGSGDAKIFGVHTNDQANAFVVSGSGNVGIGVEDPDQKLEVSGSIHLSAESAVPSAPSSGDGGILYTKADGKPYWVSNDVSEVDLTNAIINVPNAGWVTASIESSAGATALTASSLVDTLTFRAGSNVALTTEPARNIIQIAASGTNAPNVGWVTASIETSTGATALTASSQTDTLTFRAGSHIAITTEPARNIIQIAASGTVAPNATWATASIESSAGAVSLTASSLTDTITFRAGANISIDTEPSRNIIEIAASSSSGTFTGSAGPIIISGSSTGTRLEVSGSGDAIIFGVHTNDQANALVITGSGRVGLGTAVPNDILTIDNGGLSLEAQLSDVNPADGYSKIYSKYIADENTVLLLHMDGADDGTTFIDDSLSDHTVTATNALTKTGIKKFGTASGYFDGGDYLTIADSDDWSFGTAPFTIEFWAYPTSIETTWQCLGFMSSTNEAITLGFEVASGQDYGFVIDINNGGTYNATPGSKTGKTGIANNNWYHVAFVRDGTELRTYLDGVLKTTYDIGTTAVNNPTGNFTIGGPAGSSGFTNDFRGYFDEFRISKGVARYTSNFTTATAPSSGSVALRILDPLRTDSRIELKSQTIAPNSSSGYTKIFASGSGANSTVYALDGAGTEINLTSWNFPNVGWVTASIETSAGATALTASSPTDTLTFRAGSNVALTTEPARNIIQIAVSGTTAPNNPNVGWATASIETSAGATALTASSTTDTLTFRAGANVALTTEPARNIIQIAVSGTTAPNNPNVAWATASIETSAGATALTASSTTDTLTFRAGANVALTTEPSRNIIQIAVSGSSGTFTGSAGPIIISGSSTGTRLEVSGSGDALIFGVHTNAQSNALIVTGSGRVGIGTATPDYTLDVAGNVGFDEYIYHNGDADTFIRFQADKIDIEAGGENMIYVVEGSDGHTANKVTINNDLADVDFQVKGSTDPNLFRVDAGNNRVGIGSQEPSASLEISGSDDTSLLNIRSFSNANIFEISGSSSTTTHVSSSVPISASSFWANGVLITAGGGAVNNPNVGWVTASIETSAGATALTASSTTDTLTFRAGANVAITTEPARNIIQIAVSGSSGTFTGSAGPIIISGSSTGTRLEVSGSGDALIFGVHTNDQANALVITGSGRVGLGTAVPNDILTIDNGGLSLEAQTSDLAVADGYAKIYSKYVSDDKNVVLLLHMDGADDGTTFIDDSLSDHTITVASGSVTKTGIKKFGTASGLFDGSDDYLHIPYSGDFDFGSGDFTVECWYYPLASVADSYIVSINWAQGGSNLAQCVLEGSNYQNVGKMRVAAGSTDAGGGQFTDYSDPFELNTWHHIAAVKYNNVLTCYVDGVATTSPQTMTGDLVNSNHGVFIGKRDVGTHANCHLDELRITKGVARYTSNFTPASSPSSGSVALRIQDPLRTDSRIELKSQTIVPNSSSGYTKLFASGSGANSTVYALDGAGTEINLTSWNFPNVGWTTASIETSAGATALTASSTTDTLTFRAGANVALTTEPSRNIIQIAVSSSTDTFTGSAGPIIISGSSTGTRLEVSGSGDAIIFGVHTNAQSNALVVSGSGRVGIGTAAPAAALHVEGSQIYVPDEIVFSSDTDTMIRKRTSNSIEFRLAGADYYVIDASNGHYIENGNFGIGYTPTATIPKLLSVAGEALISGSSARLEITGSDAHGSIFGVHSNSNANILTVTGSGRVGMGTSTPSAQLEISGPSSGEGEAFRVTTGHTPGSGIAFVVSGSATGSQVHISGSGEGEYFRIGTSINPQILTVSSSATGSVVRISGTEGEIFSVGATTTAANYPNFLIVSASATSTPRVGVNIEEPRVTLDVAGQFRAGYDKNTYFELNNSVITNKRGASGTTWDLITDYDTYNDNDAGGFKFNPRGITALYIQGDSKFVGVGPFSPGNPPSASLHISSSLGYNSGSALFNVSVKEKGVIFSISGSGDVGIGTETPDEQLHVYADSGDAILKVSTHTSADDAIIILDAGSTSDYSYIQYKLGGTQYFNTGVDAANSNNFYIYSATGTAERVLNVTTTNRVGIGVTDPDTKLEVSGAIHISAESTVPSAPSAGDGGILYTKVDGKPYWISNDVSETDLTSGGGGGAVNNPNVGWVTASIETSAGATALTASSTTDTLTFRAGANISITTEPARNIIQIAASSSGGSFTGSAGPIVISGSSVGTRLEISGSGDALMFGVHTNAQSNALVVSGSGKVGVGTPSPKVAFDCHQDPTGLQDDTGGGEVVTFGTSGTLTVGKLYYLHTDGRWEEADASAPSTGADQFLAIALATSATGSGGGMLIRGFFDGTSYLSNFSAGKAVYVDTAIGEMNTGIPSGSGEFVRVLGHCTDTANVLYFNPSGDWVEL